MICEALEKALKEAENNKKKLVNAQNYVLIESDKEYPAVILDVSLSNNQNAVDVEFLVYNTADGTSKNHRFFLNGQGEFYFQQFCKTLGVKSYKKLPGKMLSLHFTQNGDFQNVRADAELSKADIEEHICKLKSVKKKTVQKKVDAKNARKKAVHKKKYQEPLDDGFPDDDFLPEDDE